jgi:hypothetical protein
MNELLSKLSSYNLFNYLFPGIIFAFLADQITSYSFVQSNLLVGLFLYYFIGLVISRFGSLVLEPFLKKIKFVQFEDYEKYCDACKRDSTLETLNEANNMYRTLCSLFFLLLLLKLYELLGSLVPGLRRWSVIILVILLFVTFLFSYKKQTGYVTKRIKANG